MKPRLTLNISRSFSKVPAGRYRTDGPQSGQVFLEEKLLPALENSDVVEVVLDGTDGFGSSFLDEAFAGLLRITAMSVAEFKRRVLLISEEDPTLIEEVEGYVEEEAARQSAAQAR